jgi:glycogen(starch) synthase
VKLAAGLQGNKAMKVFMLGWEFPPYISGGLGTACYGLTRGLDEVGVKVLFVLPTALPQGAGQAGPAAVSVVSAGPKTKGGGAEEKGQGVFEHMEMRVLPAVLQAYGQPADYAKAVEKLRRLQAKGQWKAAGISIPIGSLAPGALAGGYRGDLMGQVRRYATLAAQLALEEKFDVIHAHDWMTYPAGLTVAALTGKPLAVHVHSTEFDRSGEHVHQQVYDIERAGMHGADCVICVSHLTRSIVLGRYGVPAEKVQVVYNAVDPPKGGDFDVTPIRRDEKIVLFLGRITMQKGPEYFLRAAKKVVEKYKKVRFVITGSGDLIGSAVELTAALSLGRYVTFTGFLRGDDVDRVFRMADLYVMPSVSEPFGIAPLEALSHNVPVIISKQSGVSEVLTHVLKVDFWDVDEMANKILAVLRHPPLQRVLREQGQIELRKLSWRDAAQRCKVIYEQLAGAAHVA